MPVSFVTGLADNPLTPKKLSFKNLVYFGIRDLDAPEWEFVKKYNIKYYTALDIKEKGIDQVLSQVQNEILAKNPNAKIHVSFDVDAVDPVLSSSTGTPVQVGITSADVGKIIQFAWNRLVALDIVEFNPKLGDLATSTRNLTEVFESFLK
jgi:arginase